MVFRCTIIQKLHAENEKDPHHRFRSTHNVTGRWTTGVYVIIENCQGAIKVNNNSEKTKAKKMDQTQTY